MIFRASSGLEILRLRASFAWSSDIDPETQLYGYPTRSGDRESISASVFSVSRTVGVGRFGGTCIVSCNSTDIELSAVSAEIENGELVDRGFKKR